MWPREAFARFWSTIAGSCSSRSAVTFYDPAASRPHDLDDPFFDRKVQEGVGRAIAEAALSGARTSNKLESSSRTWRRQPARGSVPRRLL